MAAGDTMQGRKLPDGTPRKQHQAGDYWRDPFGTWMCRPPKGPGGHLANHDVTEHEDGTITVSPSILTAEWHGYLEKGIWREV